MKPSTMQLMKFSKNLTDLFNKKAAIKWTYSISWLLFYKSESVKYGQDLIAYLHSPADDADASSRHQQ